MCNKVAGSCLLALTFVRDWLVTSKMLKILNDVVFSNHDIDPDYIDSDPAVA